MKETVNPLGMSVEVFCQYSFYSFSKFCWDKSFTKKLIKKCKLNRFPDFYLFRLENS